MKELLTSIIAGVSGAIISIPIILLIVKRLSQNTLDYFFHQVEKRFATKLELESRIASNLMDKQIAVYPALSEIIYKAKTGVDEIVKAKNKFELLNPDLTEACRTLTTNLHSYRIYLHEDLFSLVHKYKHLLQDVLVITDTYLRQQNSLSENNEVLPTDVKEKITVISGEISMLCNEIIQLLRGRMTKLAGKFVQG